MPLNKLQKEAVEYLDGPLLVLAGPGTGKTQLLSSKVEYILKNTDANPENILCLTFTESGASNMRDRLYSMIGRASSKVNIHTYHAFGSDILAAYKHYATEFSRNLDSPIDEITTYKIIKNIQDNLDGNDILRTANISDLIDTISSAKSARLNAEDLEQIAKDNLLVTEKINPELSEILENLVPRMKFEDAISKVYNPILEVLAKHIKKDPIAKNIEREVNTYVLELNQIINAELEKEKHSVSPLSKWKDKRFEKDEDGNYRLKNLVSNKKLLSLSNIMKKYDSYLEQEGLFDFSDMIEEAIRILKTDGGFRATLSERYQYILLDEFQDTNPSQAELIYLLTDYDKPVVMAVGDDDQAIFEFQGANSSNFLDFQNHYNAKVITLKENYRSTAEILEFSRKIADQLESSFAKTNNIDKNLIAKREETEVSSHISRHEFISAEAEYYWVADQIANLVKAGVPQKEIAIIAPKHKYIIPLLPYLKSHEKVYVAYEKRDNLLQDQKISELLTLSKFIYELSETKKSDHKILEILSFPFWKLPPSTIIETIKPEKEKSILKTLLESNNEKIKEIGFLLSTLVTKSFETPLELFFDYLTGNAEIPTLDPETAEEITIKSPYLDYYSKNEKTDYKTFTLYENLNVLKSAIINHTKNDTPKLKDLIGFLDDYEVAGAALINTSPYQDSEDAVQILTVHKSKGLEFKYVFLIAMDNMSWGKSKGNNNLLTLPANLTSIRHTGITDDERLRLLFVAITRAKTDLIITNSISDFSGKNPARLEYLEEHEENGKIISPLLKNPEIITHYDDLEEAKKETDLRLSWISAYKTLDVDLKPILLKRLENYKLTASDLTTFIDIIYAGPTEFYKNKVLLSPREPLTKNTSLGNLIHQAFEAVTTKHISNEEAIELFREEATKEPLEPNDRKYLLDVGPTALEASLKTFEAILRAENSLAEVNLYSEHLMLDKVPLTGKIDHVNIDKATKTIEIYDFKTSSHHPPVRWDSQPTPFKYKLQLGFYKLLLNLSPTYQNYKVTRGHILYVKPDDYGKVYDEVYDFPEKDEVELKNLIDSVYQHIKSLDFVDDPDLFITPDENKTLKDIKNFIEKILN